MEIAVDTDKCVASGACVLEAPDLFDQDDDGIVVVLEGRTVDPVSARRAAAVCPAAVIRLQDAPPTS